MKVVLVNGPPRSGKDTVGHMLAFYYRAQSAKFSEFLKLQANRLYGFPNAAHDAFEDVKDEPQDYLYGKTWREVWIALSETYYKPLHGVDFFGRVLADELEYGYGPLIVVTDSGFEPEAVTLMDRFQEAEFHVIQLERKGHSFKSDSRGYVEPFGVPTTRITNNGSLDDLRSLVLAWARKHIGEPAEAVQ